MSLLRNYMPTLPRHTLVWYHTSRWMGWCRNGHIVSSFALQLCANAERERVVLQEGGSCRDSRGWSQTCPGRGVIGHWSRQEQVVQTVTVVPPYALLWYASGSTCLVRYPVSSNTTLQPQDYLGPLSFVITTICCFYCKLLPTMFSPDILTSLIFRK